MEEMVYASGKEVERDAVKLVLWWGEAGESPPLSEINSSCSKGLWYLTSPLLSPSRVHKA
jgi:hypothetical protein